MRLAALRTYPVKSLAGRDHDTVMATSIGLEGDRRWAVVDASGEVLTQRRFPAMAKIDARPAHGGLDLSVDGRSLHVPVPDPERRVTIGIWGARVETALADDAAAAFLGEALDLDCRLVHLDRTDARPIDATQAVSLADAAPVLVTTTGSLAALNAALARHGLDPVPMDRFRPNLVIAHDEPWAEHRWTSVRIGASAWRSLGPCERCQVPTIDQTTGFVDPHGAAAKGLLRTLVGLAGVERRAVFGINAALVEAAAPGERTAPPLRVGDWVTVADRV